jgi:hypothetical protein
MRAADAGEHTGHRLQHDCASTLRWYGDYTTFVTGDLSLISSYSDKEAAAAGWISPVNVRNDRQRSVRHASSVADGRRAAIHRKLESASICQER